MALSIDCVAIGEQAQSLEQIPPDSLMELKGFLANRSNKSRWVVFHVTEFDLK